MSGAMKITEVYYQKPVITDIDYSIGESVDISSQRLEVTYVEYERPALSFVTVDHEAVSLRTIWNDGALPYWNDGTVQWNVEDW
jgi:hypothetical protein